MYRVKLRSADGPVAKKHGEKSCNDEAAEPQSLCILSDRSRSALNCPQLGSEIEVECKAVVSSASSSAFFARCEIQGGTASGGVFF